MIIDTETTGLSNDARVIELAWIVVDPELREITKGSSLVRGDGSAGGASARAVHGIGHHELRSAPEFIEVWRSLDRFRSSRLLIAHNAPFDRRMIDNELGRVGAPPIDRIACTMRLARDLGYAERASGADKRPSVSLGALSARLRLDVTPTHRALADTETVLAMLHHFRRRHPDAVRQFISQ